MEPHICKVVLENYEAPEYIEEFFNNNFISKDYPKGVPMSEILDLCEKLDLETEALWFMDTIDYCWLSSGFPTLVLDKLKNKHLFYAGEVILTSDLELEGKIVALGGLQVRGDLTLRGEAEIYRTKVKCFNLYLYNNSSIYDEVQCYKAEFYDKSKGSCKLLCHSAFFNDDSYNSDTIQAYRVSAAREVAHNMEIRSAEIYYPPTFPN